MKKRKGLKKRKDLKKSNSDKNGKGKTSSSLSGDKNTKNKKKNGSKKQGSDLINSRFSSLLAGDANDGYYTPMTETSSNPKLV